MIDQLIDAQLDELIRVTEGMMVPDQIRDEFNAGTKSLVGIVDFDMIAYYNGLQKLKLSNYGIKAAVVSSPEKKEVSLQYTALESAGVTLDVLDDEEFADQGFKKPVIEQSFTFRYHTIVQGETLKRIASKYYGEWTKYTLISQANGLTENDLIDNDMVGQVIKIPITAEDGLLRADDNLVFVGKYDASDPQSVQEYLYGADISLRNKRFEVDSSGDLKRVVGIACVIANLQDRMSARKGSLNVLHPDWGVNSIKSSKNLPFVVAVDHIFKDREQQAMDDPRVQTAYVNRKTISQKGDAISGEMTIEMLGDYSDVVEVKA